LKSNCSLPRLGVVVDDRVGKEHLNEEWCSICTPFRLLPLDQKKMMLRRETPIIKEGQVPCWAVDHDKLNSDEDIERILKDLKDIGYY
jgi:hypothetical protein